MTSKKCPRCYGSGERPCRCAGEDGCWYGKDVQPCSACNGTGKVRKAVALLPELRKGLGQEHCSISMPYNDRLILIAALEAMRDQKARDDAIWNDAVKAAANVLNKRWTDYDQEHGFVDYETGVVEYPGNGNEMVYEWQELEESILTLTKPSEFVVVPREPTMDMRAAAVNVTLPGIGEPPLYEKIYRAMLKAME